MKAASPSCFVVLIAGAVAVSMAASAAEIEFSPPPTTEITPPKPLTERDLEVRRFNFQSRDAGNVDLSSITPMPSAEQMAQQMRALLERMEKNGFNIGLEGADSWEQGLGGGGFDMDPFDQQMERRRSREPGPGGRQGQDNAFGSGERGLDRDRRGEPGRQNQFDSNGTRMGSERSDPLNRNEQPAFIEALDLYGTGSDSALRRQATGFSANSSIGLGRLGPLESDARTRDLKRREEWRRTNLGGGFDLNPLGAGSVVDPVTAGGTTQFGAEPGVGPSRGGLPTLGTTTPVTPAEDPFAANRASVPSTLRGLDIDRPGSRDTDAARARAQETQRATPMELFQRKHSNKIPGRVF